MPHDEPNHSRRPNLRNMLAVLLIALVTAGLDAQSKAWAQTALPTADVVPIVGDFLRLALGYNTGIAFGLFADIGWPLSALIGGIVLMLVFWLLVSLKEGLPSRRVLPLGLIFGGAVANFVDRVLDGRVTDFIDVGIGATRWPTFNLADSFIIMGMLVLAWTVFSARNRAANQITDGVA